MEARHFFCGLLCGLIFVAAGSVSARPPASEQRSVVPGDKVAVVDGHVVHDAGTLWQHVTNWGLIGSQFSATTTYSDAPSAMWPGPSGEEYLWAAGLWVGARVGGVPHVTSGAFGTEFRPTPAPGDTIFATAAGAAAGNRYPWPGADDDGDGVEDEEILNGRDDDGDGLVDEDFAAFGDQQFVCAYNDLEPDIPVQLPDHVALGVNVVQRSIQWGDPLREDFIGYDFTITNVGTQTLDDVFLGLLSDHDLGRRGDAGLADNDYAGFVDAQVTTVSGRAVSVHMSYMYDGPGSGHVDGYAGWVLCDHTTDPAGLVAPTEVGLGSYQCTTGNASFANGGDPTNDAERYQLLSAQGRDPDVAPLNDADYRTLIASGPFAQLLPGQSLSYRVALVLGDGLDELIANAAEAVATCQGVAFDRDDDPTNGNEFTVPWLGFDQAPVSAAAGTLSMASLTAGGVELVLSAAGGAAADLQVVRRAGAGVPERRWRADALEALGRDGNRDRFRLRDTDAVGWPRRYDLELAVDGGSPLVLDELQLAGPAATALALHAGPNPFNPLVKVQYALPRAGAARLQAFDVRGHLVRTLLEGVFEAGSGELDWRGDDDMGRALASGVYQLRLETAGGRALTRVTLVR